MTDEELAVLDSAIKHAFDAGALHAYESAAAAHEQLTKTTYKRWLNTMIAKIKSRAGE